jgi:chorismate--pyruvate lyase
LSERKQNQSIIEPSWMTWRPQRFAGLSPEIESWLLDEGSLTRKVVMACGEGAFRVRVLHQGWGRPSYNESQVLGQRRSKAALIREVELLCNDQPLVFARTLIPATSLKGSARRLTLLGDKPLGAVLFSDSSIRRGITQYARLQPRHPLFAAATDHLPQPPTELWGRRTLFYISGRPLLVNEIFLPTLFRGEEA